ncbi:MAG TPA: tetratricopeptide repeat protein [Candidatus Sulfotelmatobacter sp.]
MRTALRSNLNPVTARRDRVPELLRRVWAIVFAGSVFAAAGFAQINGNAKNSNTAHQPPNGYVGNHACASCHASIYNSYARTPMAHASGDAIENLAPADFVHEKSKVHYRIYSEGNTAWLSFERPGDPAATGKRQLLYAIGSGRRGRSYLFAVDGFVFESPVNWYADGHRWDMAPAYGMAREIPLNLPAYPECLRCHTSGMQSPINGSQNEYPMPLFTQDGVGCERCHGPGAAHAKGAAIVNPMKLTPDRRDSVCMQCHLEGSVAIERAGHHASDFRPGDVLDDYIRHYVLSAGQAPGLGANSQFEALAQSKCKKKSGDSMSCMSCHDPHSYPSADERASFYRGKCLACHGVAFGVKHHPDKPDCTACHMPPSLSTDIAHTEVTDHRIPRLPGLSPELLEEPVAKQTSSSSLLPFPYSKEAADDVRDLALAWESLAGSGTPEAASQADRLLPLTAKQLPNDPAVLSGLAYVELSHHAQDRARELYQKALALDPTLIDAATNLGVIEARSGHLSAAVALWQGAFIRAPGNSSIGMNLARTFCEAGQMKDARLYVSRVLHFNPDLTEARKLLQHLNADPPDCRR